MARPTSVPKAQLFHNELRQARCPTFNLGGRESDEEQKERDGKSVVEAGFYIERLADAHRHTLAIHNDLSQASVGRREDGAQDSRLPDGDFGKHQPRDNYTKRDSQQHANAQ